MNAVINDTNCGRLLERAMLEQIIRVANTKANRTLAAGEMRELVQFVRDQNLRRFYNMQFRNAAEILANEFVLVSSDDDEIDLREMQNSEIMNTTPDENQYKFTAHAKRLGASVHDPQLRKKISTGNSEQALKYIAEAVNPQEIDKLYERARSSIPGLQTYENITFPRRTVILDSRNRALDGVDNRYSWNLHAAGRPGNAGDVQLPDTLQQVISMRISEFWLPLQNARFTEYKRVNLHIREFVQAPEVVERTGANLDTLSVAAQHFEFTIAQRERNRVLLQPVNPIYRFSKPIAQVNSLTLEFGAPFTRVPFAVDRARFTADYTGTNAIYTSSVAHGLATGDLVYIHSANTTNTSINNSLTNLAGVFITRINATSFEVSGIDTSGVTGTQNNVLVFFGSQRIVVSLEFTSLEH